MADSSELKLYKTTGKCGADHTITLFTLAFSELEANKIAREITNRRSDYRFVSFKSVEYNSPGVISIYFKNC